MQAEIIAGAQLLDDAFISQLRSFEHVPSARLRARNWQRQLIIPFERGLTKAQQPPQTREYRNRLSNEATIGKSAISWYIIGARI